MTKNEIFQFVNKLNKMDIPTMIYRETVFDIISFGKSSKIHLAATASIERIKRVLSEYKVEDAKDEKNTLKVVIENDTFFIHSIFKVPYESFIKNMVATDLTFNSLLMKANGQIFDMYGGLNDLKAKKLSFVESFNEEPKTYLTLNCIRYIYKNNFKYDERVKSYIEKNIVTFSRNEKTNALFYLVEFLNKVQDDERIPLILNEEFFKSDKYPNISIDNYNEVISSIGKELFIYLLLLLLNVNVNKSRFSSIINADEFTEIKNAFYLDLNDEFVYYDLKEKKGYDFLTTIISLQREFARIICSDYKEPEYHSSNIFDLLEQNNVASTFNDEFMLNDNVCEEKIELPKQNDFAENLTPSANIEELDFSSIFSDSVTENEPEVSVSFSSSEVDTIDDVERYIATDGNYDIEPPVLVTEVVSAEKESEETVVIPQNEENKMISQDVEEKENQTFSSSVFSEDDDILDLLNSDDDREVPHSENKRSKNPNLVTNLNDEKIDVSETVVSETNANDILTETPDVVDTSQEVVYDISESDNELDIDSLFVSSSSADIPVSTPITEHFERAPQTKTDDLIDSIFNEEVKVPEISLSPEFDALASQVAKEAEQSQDNQRFARNVVDEKIMSDVFSDADIEKMQHPEQHAEQPYENLNLDISEQDLEEILAELNGKKNNTFLDDDLASPDETENSLTNQNNFVNVQIRENNRYVAPQTPTMSTSDNDFFRSLHDDFTEIVGGN